jgi:sulfate adenylyltransferase subunit 1
VQYVIRPQSAEHPDYRGYAGQIAAGAFRVGESVTVLPSGRATRIAGIDLLGRSVDVAWTPQSVTLLLEDDIDISRGDLIVPSKDAPPTTQDIEATVCHVADEPLRVGHRVLLKHGTRTVKAIVKDIPSRLTLDDLSPHPHPGQLAANDIGRVKIRTAEPLPVDSYADSRRTGSFLLIDPADGTTLTAGMVGASCTAPEPVRNETTDDGWDL